MMSSGDTLGAISSIVVGADHAVARDTSTVLSIAINRAAHIPNGHRLQGERL